MGFFGPAGRWATPRIVPIGRFVVATIAAVANVFVVAELVERYFLGQPAPAKPPVLSIPESAWRPPLFAAATRQAPEPEAPAAAAPRPAPALQAAADPPPPPGVPLEDGWQRQEISLPGRTLYLLRLPPAFAWQLEGATWIEVAAEDRPTRRLAVHQVLPEPTTVLLPAQIDEIHAIGLASCVDLAGLDADERHALLREQEELADRRARALAGAVSSWLARGGRPKVPVYALNAGLDLAPCTSDDDRNRHQRGILLVAVNGEPAGTEDLRSALRQAGLDGYSRIRLP